MGCVFSVSGTALDVDTFVENTGIAGFKKKHRGDLISVKRNERLEYSWAALSITEDNFDDINIQIKEAENFLIKNRDWLKQIATTKEIEYATINFGVTSKTQEPNKVQSFYLPVSLLLICTELKLGIEISTYSF